MSAVFDFTDGDSPLLVSIPHDGRELAPGMADRMTEAGRALPDTDWHVRRLYDFCADVDAGVLAANYSRYVVDLNRPADDTALYPGQMSTGLCPAATFSGAPIYADAAGVTGTEQRRRVEAYWQPYHDKLRAELDRRLAKFGYALLWDAHSILSKVPSLFAGTLPDLNIGTNDGASCGNGIESAIDEVARSSAFSCVMNGRFNGGYITRHYGDPGAGMHAVQLEIAQRTYMDEDDLEYLPTSAQPLRDVLGDMLSAFTAAAAPDSGS